MKLLLLSFRPLRVTFLILTLLCSQSIIISAQDCITSPVLTCPPTYYGCPGDDVAPEALGFATALPGDANCLDPVITFRDTVYVDDPCGSGQEIKRFWRATYPDSSLAWLTAECTQILILRDNDHPEFMNCPADIIVASDTSCSAVVNWNPPTVRDDCGIQSLTSNYSPGASFEIGTTEITYTAIDICGNISTCSFNIEVTGNCCDDTPVIQIPPDFTGCPGSSTEPSNTGQATAMIPGANCEAPIVNHSDEILEDVDCHQVIKRTWMATNPNYSEKQDSGIQMITLQDTLPPVIRNCPEDITVVSNSSCFAIVDWMLPSANDNCGISAFFSDRPTGSGSRFEIGTTRITYTALDACGNKSECSFEVTVVANCCEDELVVFCPPKYIGCPGSSIHPNITGWGGTNESSVCPASVAYFDIVRSEGPCTGAKTIDRYWVASRADNPMKDTCIQKIILEDKQAPIILTCPPDVERPYDDRVYNWPEPEVSDNCHASITYNIANGSSFPVGITEVHVLVKDDCGNETSCQFTITILPPDTSSNLVVTCPSDIILGCGDGQSGPVPVPDVMTDCELCPENDIPGFVFMGSRNGHTYYCSKDKMTWPKAKAFCEDNGGHLVIINDEDENHFLSHILQTNSAYIGLSDHKKEGHFEWVDGSGLSYSKWYPRQPNNYYGRQDYVEILRNGYWNDQYNDLKLEFIMELPCIGITQIAGPHNLEDVTSSTTVSFAVMDACGNSDTCSYEIVLDNKVSISCHQDIEVNSVANETAVYYKPPQFNTCCDECDHQREIPGFVYMGARDGSYYYCSKDKEVWHDANAITRKNGGHLAIIENAGENSYLAHLLGHTIAFIGISDHANENEWRTVDGQKQQYFNWRYDNPNNYGGVQHYVELEPSGKWNDNSAIYKREYIMEIKGCGHVRQTDGIPSGGFFPQGSTRIEFKGQDNCGNSKICAFHVSVVGDPNIVKDYCASYSKSSSRAFIDKVQIDNFVHTSGDNNGYLDYTDKCISVRSGDVFKLHITPGWQSYRYLAYYKIYGDWNGDGDFDDPDEYLGKARSNQSVAGALTVPSYAPSGTTKLRIIMSLMGYEESCGSYSFGETEDYCLQISGHLSGLNMVKSTGSKSAIDQPIIFTDIPSLYASTLNNIAPNPTSDFFTIRNEEIINRLDIIAIDGQVTKRISNPSGQIDVSDLSSGLYLIRMIDDAGLQIIEKIVIE